MTIYQAVNNITINTDTSNNNSTGSTKQLINLCLRDNSNGDPCLISSVLEDWLYAPALLNAEANDTSVLNTINSKNDVDYYERYIGGIQTLSSSANSNISSADAVAIYYFLQDNRVVVDGEYVDEEAEAWEEKYLDLMQSPTAISGSSSGNSNGEVDTNDISIYPFASRSFGDEFGSAIQGDISLLLAAYMILLVYVAINLGKLDPHFIRSRVGLAFAVLLTVGFAIICSIGLASAIGVIYTPLHSVLPFILLGMY